MPNGTLFEPQRASVRAGVGNIWESGPHASALRLTIHTASAILATALPLIFKA